MLLSKTYKRHVPDNIAPVSPKLKKIVPPINIEPLLKLGEGLTDKQFFLKKVKTLPCDFPSPRHSCLSKRRDWPFIIVYIYLLQLQKSDDYGDGGEKQDDCDIF